MMIRIEHRMDMGLIESAIMICLEELSGWQQKIFFLRNFLDTVDKWIEMEKIKTKKKSG
jgi:hypothetical protein